jgi:membrane protein YdbS with pleckstrin-like domain
MAFSKKLLNENEGIVLDLKPHWMYFLEPIVGVAILVGVAVLLAVLGWFDVAILGWVFAAAVVGVLGWLGIRFLIWSNTSFVITTDRVIYRSGVLSKSGIQIPLERINNVNFHQRLWERFFGAGDLLIESAGTSGQSRFSDINHPDHVQNTIYKAMEGNENKGWQQVADAASQVAGASGVVQPAGLSLAQELEALEGLRNRGSITPEEFERQKQRLLGGLPPPAAGSPPPPPV